MSRTLRNMPPPDGRPRVAPAPSIGPAFGEPNAPSLRGAEVVAARAPPTRAAIADQRDLVVAIGLCPATAGRRSRGVLPCLALAASFASAAASAQTASEDFQVWTYATISKPLSDKVDATVDLHAALTDDADRASQYLIRPSVSYEISEQFALGGGYAYVRRDPVDDAAVNEHRIFQQIRFRLRREDAGLQVSTTTRLEQRFEEDSDETGWRLRHQTRLDLPVRRGTEVKLVLWNEPFYSLNSTSWSGRRGLSAMFNFAGISIPLSKQVTLEPGYLNFRVFVPGRDRVNHVAGLFAAVQL